MRNDEIIKAYDAILVDNKSKMRVMKKIEQRQTLHDRKNRMFVPKFAAAAAVIVALTTTAVAVYGSGILQRIMLSGSVAEQVTNVDEPIAGFTFGDEIKHVYGNHFRLSVYDKDGNTRFGTDTTDITWFELWNRSATIEDFYELAPAHVSKLTYLPANLEPVNIAIVHDEHGDAVIFNYSSHEIGVGLFQIQFMQYYVGQGGRFNLETTNPMEEIKAGDISALMTKEDVYFGERAYIQRRMVWYQDGNVYDLIATYNRSGFSDEWVVGSMLTMAQSLE